MCDICSGKMTEQDFRERVFNTILEQGIQIIYVPDGDPAYAYTIGRSLAKEPEFFITGLDADTMQRLLSGAAQIALNEDVKDGYVFEPGTLVMHFPIKAVAVHPVESNLMQAVYTFGNSEDPTGGITALQLVWPDDQGRFPGEPGAKEYNQPIRRLTNG